MNSNRWSLLLFGLFLSLLVWYLVYTQSIVVGLHQSEERMTEVVALVQELIQSTDVTESASQRVSPPSGGSFETVLFELQKVVIESGIPMIWMGADGTVFSIENLPFETDIYTPRGQELVRDLVRQYESDGHLPVMGVTGSLIYFGDTPEVTGLQWIPLLQASGLLITALIGFLVIKYQRKAEQEKAWTAMARELAHQLGTPISSLKGWLELMRIPIDYRPGSIDQESLYSGISEDLIRLEKITHRFEIIGRDPNLVILNIADVLADLEEYLQKRLPKLSQGIKLKISIPEIETNILGNKILLSWALENVVKNSLDAMAGRTGEIKINVVKDSSKWLRITIEDTGPGVDPELKDKIFEAGVSGKKIGWGVGLTLARRIVTGSHSGRIYLVDNDGEGASFDIWLPISTA
jgi:signal transduction histidine kinase